VGGEQRKGTFAVSGDEVIIENVRKTNELQVRFVAEHLLAVPVVRI
jgi:hypothetical protein